MRGQNLQRNLSGHETPFSKFSRQGHENVKSEKMHVTQLHKKLTLTKIPLLWMSPDLRKRWNLLQPPHVVVNSQNHSLKKASRETFSFNGCAALLINFLQMICFLQLQPSQLTCFTFSHQFWRFFISFWKSGKRL